MAQINFGLLDPNQPAKIAAAPFDAYQNTLANLQQLEAGKRQMRLADLGIQAKEQELADAGSNRALAAENLAFDRQNKQVARAKQLTDIQKFYAGKVFAQPTEAAAMAAMNEYARLTNDDVTEQVNYIRSLGGNPEQIKAWAQGYLEPQTVQKEKPSALGQLIAERDSLPPNDPRRKLYNQQIAKATTHAPPVSVSYGSPVAGVDAQGNPVFFQPSKGGGAPAVIPGVRPADSSKPPTEAEAKAAFYAGNMRAASKVLEDLESNGFNMASVANQAETAIAGGRANIAAGQAAQRAKQAQRQWAEQMLRMQTGAAATQDEINRTVSTYFPQIGDSAETIAQKRDMRGQAEQGVFAAAGRAAGRVEQQSANKGPAKVASDADYNALPSGAVFVGPDGKTRRKP